MKRSPLFYLILITIFGALARCWFFWLDGLHTDELFTLNLVSTNLTHIITFSMTTDCNPPFFYIIDYFSVLVFGYNAFAERLPSILAGIFLIPASYYLGKEYRGETLGLLTALAIATLGSMWYYSGFGRAYMTECLLFTVFCIFYIRLLRYDRDPKNWWGVVIMAVLLAYTHLFSIIPVALLLVYLVTVDRDPGIKAIIVTFVMSSPLLLLFHAILVARTATSRAVGMKTLGFFGSPVPQLVLFMPMEYFGYLFVFWVPMVVYSTWIYRRLREVTVMVCTAALSFLVLLALADTTPVFIRYTLLVVPVLVTIGLLPVADLIDSPDHTKAQKWFIVGSFAIFYFAITLFQFWSGFYMGKGTYFV